MSGSSSVFTQDDLANFFSELSEEKRQEVLETFKEQGKWLDSETAKFKGTRPNLVKNV